MTNCTKLPTWEPLMLYSTTSWVTIFGFFLGWQVQPAELTQTPGGISTDYSPYKVKESQLTGASGHHDVRGKHCLRYEVFRLRHLHGHVSYHAPEQSQHQSFMFQLCLCWLRKELKIFTLCPVIFTGRRRAGGTRMIAAREGRGIELT